ncbi:MAG: hypothetical protein OEL76_10730 [Siculibacillus sp.]|nr:hypothetical protein [Siculibacillus sp.]
MADFENSPTATVSVRGLALAKASITNLREEARLVRQQAAALAAAKRRSPHLFHEKDVLADLAEAERLAAHHDRRADEIELATYTGLLSRSPEVVKIEVAERRHRAAEEVFALGVAPEQALPSTAATSATSNGIRPSAIPATPEPEPARPAFETRPVALPAGFRAAREEA